jgi:hypothetical protein
MSGPKANSRKLSLSEKFARLRTRLKGDSEWRRYGSALLLAGKALGMVIVLLTITVVSGCSSPVHAQTVAPEVKARTS